MAELKKEYKHYPHQCLVAAKMLQAKSNWSMAIAEPGMGKSFVILMIAYYQIFVIKVRQVVVCAINSLVARQLENHAREHALEGANIIIQETTDLAKVGKSYPDAVLILDEADLYASLYLVSFTQTEIRGMLSLLGRKVFLLSATLADYW